MLGGVLEQDIEPLRGELGWGQLPGAPQELFPQPWGLEGSWEWESSQEEKRGEPS